MNRADDYYTDLINEVYTERNKVIALAAKLALMQGYKAWKVPTVDDWPLVFIELPLAQLSWHIPIAEIDLFDFLPYGDNTWDGHSTADKYNRLERFVTASAE